MTPKQQIFVSEYLIDLNATKAAERAGYAKSYARRASYDLLRKPAVAAAVAAGMAARARRTEIDADRVLREYANLAFVDIRRLVKQSKDGGIELRALWEIPDADAAAITHLWQTSRGNGLRIRLSDKCGALDAMGRHLGIQRQRSQPFAGDYSNEEQREAREALQAQVEQVLKERADAEPEADG